ncbi:uncharacterized protein PHALS_14576 [Plasmopara halstedii]|uniref:Uncharacterized protein n=1 Tax=Plasmopara halstedii TaxID=4781 RepID=A0A0P1AM85_PLAHL|nr:uncharacterized protein PHALS_14576 [Plasmopara halstedii]CEG41846.1 hypothetical protein PHALS_14576 [Plasmopara halstedii]|eukprot:XP_024578215.1 hypothetical protein PHALS_14576 [Plasmopara halstedii]
MIQPLRQIVAEKDFNAFKGNGVTEYAYFLTLPVSLLLLKGFNHFKRWCRDALLRHNISPLVLTLELYPCSLRIRWIRLVPA